MESEWEPMPPDVAKHLRDVYGPQGIPPNSMNAQFVVPPELKGLDRLAAQVSNTLPILPGSCWRRKEGLVLVQAIDYPMPGMVSWIDYKGCFQSAPVPAFRLACTWIADSGEKS